MVGVRLRVRVRVRARGRGRVRVRVRFRVGVWVRGRSGPESGPPARSTPPCRRLPLGVITR